MAENHDDILIVGAGPTGLAMACSLLERGVPCRVIEKDSTRSVESRALAIQPRSMEIFDTLDILNPLIDIGRKISTVNAYYGSGKLFRFSLSDLNTPYPFVLIVPQSDTEKILEERVRALGGKIERSKELLSLSQSKDGVEATVSGSGKSEVIYTPYLVGCDGAQSSVRKAIQLPFDGYSQKGSFALADVSMFWGHQDNECHLFLSPSGVLVVIPLPGKDRYRIIVTVEKDIDENELTLQTFQSLVDRRSPRYPYISLHSVTWMAPFSVHYRIASSFQNGRVFLAGDAAHIHSPVGGEGMNLGIHDAYNLSWKLAFARKNLGGKNILKSYTLDRYPPAANTLPAVEFATKTAMLPMPIMHLIRNILIKFLFRLNVVQKFIKESLSELRTNYRRSLFVEDASKGLHKYRTPKAGDRAPAVSHVKNAYSEEEKDLFKIIHGTGYHLILFCGTRSAKKSAGKLERISNKIIERFGSFILPHLVLSSGMTANDVGSVPSLFTDDNNSFHDTYSAVRDTIFLVRPDGYIAFRSQPADEKALFHYLEGCFGAQILTTDTQ